MKRIAVTGIMIVSLSGCAGIGAIFQKKPPPEPVTSEVALPPVEEVETAVLAPETAAPPPPPAARTVEALDTTTPEQRAAAVAPPAVPSKVLGKTVVSLGSPTEPGLWIKTPLTKVETQGRVTNPANGKTSLVTLIPLEGPVTAGSRMSLPALRLIGASLTDLTEVEVALES